MQCEHVLMRRDVALSLTLSLALLGAPDFPAAGALRRLGAALEAHVRLEESIVFPLIEAALPEAALARLADVLAAWRAENSPAASPDADRKL